MQTTSMADRTITIDPLGRINHFSRVENFTILLVIIGKYFAGKI